MTSNSCRVSTLKATLSSAAVILPQRIAKTSALLLLLILWSAASADTSSTPFLADFCPSANPVHVPRRQADRVLKSFSYRRSRSWRGPVRSMQPLAAWPAQNHAVLKASGLVWLRPVKSCDCFTWHVRLHQDPVPANWLKIMQQLQGKQKNPETILALYE